jgi:hypothetical protein
MKAFEIKTHNHEEHEGHEVFNKYFFVSFVVNKAFGGV